MSKPLENKSSVLQLHSKNVYLEIFPEKGGCITRYSLKHKDSTFELLSPANPSDIIKKNHLGNASFPLIPFSNRIRNGCFSFLEKKIKLPLNFLPEPHSIHGHGWEMKWDVLKVEKNLAILEYRYFPNEWPFPYLANLIFELIETKLTITMKIKNIGKTLMPAGLGFHPYFLKTKNSTITTDTKKMWVNDSEKIPYVLKNVPYTKILSKGLFVNKNELDNIFTGWNHNTKISWPEWRVNLFINSDSPIDFLIIYIPSGEDYFCVEPVSNVTDAFNMMGKNIKNHGAKILKPKEILEGKVRFSPEIY